MSRFVLVLSIQISRQGFSFVSLLTHVVHTSIKEYRNPYKLELFLLIIISRLFLITVSRIETDIIIIFDLCFHQDFQDNRNLWELPKLSKVLTFELCLKWFEFFAVYSNSKQSSEKMKFQISSLSALLCRHLYIMIE